MLTKLSLKESQVLWHTRVIPAMWEADVGGLGLQPDSGYLKNNLKQQRTGSMD
jgi:hypothetical protein